MPRLGPLFFTKSCEYLIYTNYYLSPENTKNPETLMSAAVDIENFYSLKLDC